MPGSRSSCPLICCWNETTHKVLTRLCFRCLHHTDTTHTVAPAQYDEGMKQYLSMKAFDESKRLAAPFKPNSASQAKNMTSIKYFMNSPREGDAATLPAFMKSTL